MPRSASRSVSGRPPRHRRPTARVTRRTTTRRTTTRRTTTRLATLLTTVAVLLGLAGPGLAAPPSVDPGPAIEGFAPYQGQNTCNPVARPGVTAFRGLFLASYPGTGDYGIVRACNLGGTSEHKEGRAWDWRVSASDPVQRAQADDAMRWLLATDDHGNQAAMARRLGIMYMVWNKKIWKSYQASRGWQPYSGSNPHTDHVHLSFGWAGAYGATSYWTGTVAPVMTAPAARPPITVPGRPTPDPQTPDPDSDSRQEPVSATSTVGIDPGPESVTATITTGRPAPLPTDPVAARRSQVLQQRAVLAGLRGPWRRH